VSGHSNAESPAGVEPGDGGNAAVLCTRDWIRLALRFIASAAEETCDGDLIEAQTLCTQWLARHPEPAQGGQVREGERSGEAPHGEAQEARG